MRKNENGLQWIVTETAQKKLHFPWGAWVVCAVLTVGFCLLLTAAFPSVPYPWWAMTAAAILVQAALLIVYQTRIGNWLVPAGIGVLLLLSLALNKFVLPGFGTLANDFLTLLTKKTGKIYLDLAAADAQFLPLAVTVLLLAVSLLLSRSAWSGRMLLALPILLPCYAALLLGLFPIGIGGGLLIIGTVLLMVQHTAEGEALAVVPAQLILPVLCAALCLLIGLSCQDKLNTDMVETMQTQLHQRHYDSDTNSMPEGNLKNLPVWNKSDTPALEVTMEQPEKVYLRGQVYDTYTGTGWKAADTEETAQYEDLFYWLHEAGFYGQSQIALADGYTETATPLSMTIRNLSACSAHGYYPYAVYGSETLEADRIGDTALPPAESLPYLKGSVPEWYQIQRNLSTAQGRENIKTYLSKEQAYSDYLQTVDLQMTQDSWSVLQRQLKLDSQARTIGDIRTIIFDYLRENMTYDESARTMNGSGDFLQYTLDVVGQLRVVDVHNARLVDVIAGSNLLGLGSGLRDLGLGVRRGKIGTVHDHQPAVHILAVSGGLVHDVLAVGKGLALFGGAGHGHQEYGLVVHFHKLGNGDIHGRNGFLFDGDNQIAGHLGDGVAAVLAFGDGNGLAAHSRGDGVLEVILLIHGEGVGRVLRDGGCALGIARTGACEADAEGLRGLDCLVAVDDDITGHVRAGDGVGGRAVFIHNSSVVSELSALAGSE